MLLLSVQSNPRAAYDVIDGHERLIQLKAATRDPSLPPIFEMVSQSNGTLVSRATTVHLEKQSRSRNALLNERHSPCLPIRRTMRIRGSGVDGAKRSLSTASQCRVPWQPFSKCEQKPAARFAEVFENEIHCSLPTRRSSPGSVESLSINSIKPSCDS